MSYPVRICKCGDTHECPLLDPRENGKKRWAGVTHGVEGGEGDRPGVAPEIKLGVATPRRKAAVRPKLEVARAALQEAGAEPYHCPQHRRREKDCSYCQLGVGEGA